MLCEKFFTYFMLSSQYTIKRKMFWASLIILDYFVIFIHTLDSVQKLLDLFSGNVQGVNSNNIQLEYQNNTLSALESSSPLLLFSKLETCTMVNSKLTMCSYHFIYLICVGILFLLFIMLHFLVYQYSTERVYKHTNENQESTVRHVFRYILINFYDFFFFRLGSVFTIHVIMNYLINSYYDQSQTMKSLNLVFAIAIVCMCILTTLGYFRYFMIWFKLKDNFDYPFDTFSSKFDQIIFILKILFCIEHNLASQYNSHSLIIDTRLTFLNIITLIILFSFLSKNLFLFIFDNREILYLTNPVLNLIRLFLLIFNCLCIFFSMLFGNDINSFFSILVYISLFSFSLFCVLFIQQHRTRKIIRGNDFSSKLLLVLEAYWGNSLQRKQDSNVYRLIRQIILIHQLNCCGEHTCKICAFIKSHPKIITGHSEAVPKFLQVLYKKMKEETVTQFSPVFDLLKLSVDAIQGKGRHFKLSVMFSKMVKKYKKGHYGMAINIMLFYRYLLQENQEEVTQLESIQTIELQCENIMSFLYELEQIIFVKERTPMNFVKSSTKIRKLKQKIKKTFVEKKECEQNYQLIIVRYIVETGLNHQFRNPGQFVFDITGFEEFLDFHYANDKFILLAYNISLGNIIIKNSGSDFIKYKNKTIEEIFPHYFAREGLNSLVNSIRKRKSSTSLNIFEYPIVDLENGKNVASFKMQYTVFPSIDTKELLILGSYRVKLDEIIIFSQLDSDLVLYALSKRMGNFFHLTPDCLEDLTSFRKFFTFDFLFKFLKETRFLTISPIEQISKQKSSYSLFVVNYKNYLELYHTYMKYLYEAKGRNGYTITDGVNPLNVIQTIQFEQGCNNQYITILLKKKDEIKVQKRIFVWYYIKERTENESKQIEIIEEEEDTTREFEGGGDAKNNYGKGMGTVVGNSIWIDSNSSMGMNRSMFSRESGSQNESKFKVNRNIKSVNEKLREYRKFKIFTNTILVFNVMLIVITLMFLIIETTENQKFSNLYEVFKSFNTLNRYFYHTTLSLLANTCIGKKDSNECQDEFPNYSEKFRSENNLSNGYQIYIYVERELSIKSQYFQDNLSHFKSILYQLKNEELTTLLNTKTIYYYLSNVGDEIQLFSDTISFITSLDIYVSMIESIVESYDYLHLPIYIFSINQSKTQLTVDLSNLYSKTLSLSQRFCYNLLINYSSYLKHFEEIGKQFDKQLNGIISANKVVVNIFSFTLIAMHMILLGLCIWFISIFRKILVNYISDIMDRVQDDKNIKIYSKKIQTLQTLAKLYQENPNKLVKGSQSNNENSNTKYPSEGIIRKTAISSQQDDPKINEMPRDAHFQDRHYQAITGRFLNFFLILFFIYFAYSTSYYGVLITSLDNYVKIIDYVNMNSVMDSLIYNNFGAIQLMILTNQTEETLTEQLLTEEEREETETMSYTENRINKVFRVLSYIEQAESDHQNLISQLKDQLDFNCDSLFTTINDTITFKTNSLFTNRNYFLLFAQICKSFSFMSLNDEKILIQEITFLTQKFSKMFHSFDYETLYSLNNQVLLYDLYTQILLIFRPLRAYESNVIFFNLVQQVTFTYTIVTVTYLVLNILVELLIFFLIKRFVVKKFLEMNKGLVIFFKCLKV